MLYPMNKNYTLDNVTYGSFESSIQEFLLLSTIEYENMKFDFFAHNVHFNLVSKPKPKIVYFVCFMCFMK